MRSYSPSSSSICESNVKASTFGVFFVLLSACVLALAIFVNNFVPDPLGIQDGKLVSSQCLVRKFDARRAFKNLEKLTSIGPKIPGTYETEILTVKFLLQRIEETKNQTVGYANKIEFHVQTASGCYSTEKVCKCYHQVQNVVAKLKSDIAEATEAVLVNCHFDSAPTSPGASDDGLHCTVMLEMLRVLAFKDEPLKKNIIFLFNGAEEDGLLASHGFITQNDWAKEITCFINLEACGAGGREILFQTGPKAGILPRIYAESVPYPYGNVIGEELFQSGVLPSDTDFRIFRDYGLLKGLDFAHYKNGYVYHTSSDNISFVSTSVIQHTGSNILALLQNLVDKDDLKSSIEESNEQAIFFDILGKFMVCYSMTTAFRINISVVIFSITISTFVNMKIFKRRKVKSLSYHYTINAVFFGVGIFLVSVVLYTLAELLKWKELTMLWYSNQWFAIVYYGIPALFTITSILKLRRTSIYSTITPEEEVLVFVGITQILETFFLLAATLMDFRSSYVLVIKLTPLCISHLINYTILRNEKVKKRILVHLVCNCISLFYITYLAVPFFHLLIPMMGRAGATTDTELFIWILCQFFSIVLFLYFIPLVLLVGNYWKIQLVLACGYVIFVLLVLFGSILKPFGNNTPQRFEILHVNRKLFHPGDKAKTESSGFFLIAIDSRAPQTIKELFKNSSFKRIDDFCQKELLCGVPLSKESVARNNFQYSFWSSAPIPTFPSTKNLRFEVVEQMRTRTFFFNISGPALSEFVIQPLGQSELVAWSFESGRPRGSSHWFDEKVFFIHYIRGVEKNSTWKFWLKFDISKMTKKFHTFKLSWSAHFRVNNTNHYHSAFRNVLEKFPSWTRVSSWVTDLEEYLF